jgi:hypothetical protein
MDRSESMVFSAEYSWKKPTVTLRPMMKATTPPSIQDLIPKETAIARISTLANVSQDFTASFG